jgi:hypothetical protein
MVRDQGSGDLFLFLQGGGLCYSDLCLAVGSAPAGIPPLDVLDVEKESNPVRGWDTVYLPYCDGSLFAGDAEHDDDGDGVTDRYSYGLRNLSAALDVAHDAFPDPDRILLAGSSGGGYGTIPATVLARLVWPGVPLQVFNDSGVGLGLDGDPAFIEGIVEEFNAGALLPASRPDLTAEGHLTPLIGWQLEQDEDLEVAAFSSYEDVIISGMYLGVDGWKFNLWLEEQLGLLHTAQPERFQSFLVEGVIHTTLLGDPSGFIEGDPDELEWAASFLGSIDTTAVGDVTVADWMGEMIAGGEGWQSLAE